MHSTADPLTTRDTLVRLEANVLQRRAVEVEELELVLEWVRRHQVDPGRDEGVRRGDRLEIVGGEGTPKIQELCLVELGIARCVHTLSARKAAADALDLDHRLPQTWENVRALKADVWVARRVASMTRHLPLAVMPIIDGAVADAIAGQSPSRVFEIAEAKMIEADEEGYRAALDEKARRRYVAFSRRDASGLRTLIARVSAGDAFWIDATISFVADILAGRPDNEGRSRDELRSEAMGWLARPAELLQLMLEHLESTPAENTPDDPEPEDEPPADLDLDLDDPEPEDEPAVPNRALAFPADLLAALRNLDPARMRPKATLYVHLHEAALHGRGGVVRVEGLGPHMLAQVKDLLGHSKVAVKGVIDLAEQIRVNAYEHPEHLKERTHLIWAGDAFPHGSRTTRNVDLDHPEPYQPNGPPGQTGTHNSQPLNRTGHRAKTHLGYRADQLATGEVVWRTRHGLHRIVDTTGTHRIEESEADALSGPSDMERGLARLIHRHRTGQLG